MCQNAEKCMSLWRGNDKVVFNFSDPLNGYISKLSNVKEHIFFATTTFDLYHGTVSCEKNSSSDTVLFTVALKRAQFHAVDIACNSDYLFIVNADGHVAKVNPQDLSVVQTIVLKDEAKFCTHGFVFLFF